MKCPNCEFENIFDAKFCNACGTNLETCCQQCGKINPPGSKFCNNCGQNLTKAVSANLSTATFEHGKPNLLPIDSFASADGERRQATILFSDLSGYTPMNEKLDPEEVEAITSQIKSEAVRIVESYEGTVNQFVGDEVSALFGIPTTHEDDPIRAVRAALEIHRKVRQISGQVEDRTGIRLRMHTGINTGLIVTHTRDTRDGQYGITGDAVNTGARLAGLAGTDQVIVGPATYRLIAPYFNTTPLDAVTVAGKTIPLVPHLVTGETEVKTRFEATRVRGFTAFTGRGHEFSTLFSCFEKMLSGKGQFVTVVGDAGLGKSRLIYEFRHALNRSEITVMQGRCQSYGMSIPYFPFINALRRGFNLTEEDSPAELHEKTIANVRAIDDSLEQYLPILFHLLSIASEEYRVSEQLHDQELKKAIQEALTASFIQNTKRQPMVVIFEDWHWADEASDATLKKMVSLIASHPIMIVAIFRPDYTANWGNWSHHTPMVLHALDHMNCENILKSVWDVDQLPKGIASMIHERTGGNPFFVEEVSRELKEGGTVQGIDRQAVIKQPLDNLSFPSTVQAVIRARLDRLDHHARESIRLASVIGREFPRRILEHVSDSTIKLSDSLETLKNMELIQQIQVVPEAEYMFKHVITQEVTYETLLKKRRKELHALIGQAIEKLYADRLEEFYEMLSYHYWKGEDWFRAYEYSREAGLKAQSFSAYVESLTFLEAALDALNKLPRLKTHLEQEIDIRFNLRSPLFPLGRHEEWADHIRRAEVLSREINDNARLANCHSYLASYHWICGQHEQAIKVGEDGLNLAQSAGDFSVEMTTKLHLGISLLCTGALHRQLALHREVSERLSGPSALERHGLSSVPSITARGFLTWGLSELGQFEEAEKWARQGNELARRVQNAFSNAFIQACSGLTYLRKGEVNTALEFLKKADALVRDADIKSIFSFVATNLGSACLLSGHNDDAVTILEEAIEPRNLKLSIVSSIFPFTELSEAYRLTGKIGKAITTAEKAINILKKTKEHYFGSWTIYVMAKIQSDNGSEAMEQASQTFFQAKEQAAKLNMLPLLAHCSMALGEHYLEMKENEKARVEIFKADQLYGSLNMKFWQPKAKALLHQIS